MLRSSNFSWSRQQTRFDTTLIAHLFLSIQLYPQLEQYHKLLSEAVACSLHDSDEEKSLEAALKLLQGTKEVRKHNYIAMVHLYSEIKADHVML